MGGLFGIGGGSSGGGVDATPSKAGYSRGGEAGDPGTPNGGGSSDAIVGALGGAASPYPDDGAKRMPVYNSASVIEAGRRKRAEIIARSGRESTRLVAKSGVTPYANPGIGSTG